MRTIYECDYCNHEHDTDNEIGYCELCGIEICSHCCEYTNDIMICTRCWLKVSTDDYFDGGGE